MLTGQCIYFVGEANSANKNGPAISLNLSDYIDNLISLNHSLQVFTKSFNLGRHCAVLASLAYVEIQIQSLPCAKKKNLDYELELFHRIIET